MVKRPKGYAWRALCARVYMDPRETHCIRCGGVVDKGVRGHAPQSRSVDHIIAIEQGGPVLSRENVAIAHYGCNARHGAKVRWAKEKNRMRTPSRVIVDIDPSTL